MGPKGMINPCWESHRDEPREEEDGLDSGRKGRDLELSPQVKGKRRQGRAGGRWQVTATGRRGPAAPTGSAIFEVR